MKSVLISIQPKWVEKIVNGEKTIEVRKTRPKIETPFKCYIYETKGQYIKFIHGAHTKYGYGCGKVIGEFICDKFYDLFPFAMGTAIELLDEVVSPEIFCKESCLTEQNICDYVGEKNGYGWHISDLKIYDNPKPIMQFYKPCPIKLGFKNCTVCEHYSTYTGCCMNNIDRPPQSWLYVDELK